MKEPEKVAHFTRGGDAGRAEVKEQRLVKSARK